MPALKVTMDDLLEASSTRDGRFNESTLELECTPTSIYIQRHDPTDETKITAAWGLLTNFGRSKPYGAEYIVLKVRDNLLENAEHFKKLRTSNRKVLVGGSYEPSDPTKKLVVGVFYVDKVTL